MRLLISSSLAIHLRELQKTISLVSMATAWSRKNKSLIIFLVACLILSGVVAVRGSMRIGKDLMLFTKRYIVCLLIAFWHILLTFCDWGIHTHLSFVNVEIQRWRVCSCRGRFMRKRDWRKLLFLCHHGMPRQNTLWYEHQLKKKGYV